MNQEQELERKIERLETRLRNTQRELDGFLYAVSHDIRGPLRSILAGSVILKEDFGERLGAEGIAETERQANAARKIAGIIDSILRLSRLGREEMHATPLNLSEMATEIGGEMARANGRPAQIEVEPNLSAEGDPNHIRLLLTSLFDNAMKFRRLDGEANLHFGASCGSFYLRDDGIGFDQAHAERIFKPFERLNLESEYPGVGMGLSLVRMVALRHEGDAWAEGRPGAGATFWFTLAQDSK